MTRLPGIAAVAALLVATAPAWGWNGAIAQNPPRTLDIGGPPGDSGGRRCSESMLTAALAAFNSPTAVKAFSGNVSIPVGNVIRGNYGVYHGALRIDGTVQGNVVVLDGAARVSRTGVVTGGITVLGGHLTVDPGAQISGPRAECDEQVALMPSASGTIVLRPPGRSLRNLASDLAVYAGAFRIAPHVTVGQYNRVEALPLHLGASVSAEATPNDSVRFTGYAIVRTARDPSGSRPTVGWHAVAELVHDDGLHVTIGAEGGATVNATVDQPFSAVESGLSALVLRRDYHDWFLRRGGSVFGSIRVAPEFVLSGAFEIARQTTLLATEALSLFRSTEPWRPNPLIDDGKYQTLSARVTWDARDERAHPVLSWYGRLEVRRVSSHALTPVSLPGTIRDPLPTTNYGETESDLDLRAYLRLDPQQRVRFRLLAGGYLSGDPTTVQNRRSIGGADPLPGFEFRTINCDRRRKVDPAQPALCDREMAFQAEYHHALALNIGTRIGGYSIGIRHPDLVLLADAGSAWLAGSTAGRVPNGRIQSLSEWKSDLGIGIATGAFGLYVAKSLVDGHGPQFLVLFGRRF